MPCWVGGLFATFATFARTESCLCCVGVQVTASQLSLLEATMARMERVAVWSLMSGGGSGRDVFTVSAAAAVSVENSRWVCVSVDSEGEWVRVACRACLTHATLPCALWCRRRVVCLCFCLFTCHAGSCPAGGQHSLGEAAG